MINPPLSDAEFKTHFLFGRDKIAEVLACLQFPKTAGRPANRDFAIRCDRHGNPIRWVGAETALLVFLKRLRTRGDAVIQLQSFFGRSEGWISLVFNAVVTFIAAVWVSIKIQRLDERVFNRFRLQDYAKCLWRNGLYIPHVVGFVDGTFHSICRPGGDACWLPDKRHAARDPGARGLVSGSGAYCQHPHLRLSRESDLCSLPLCPPRRLLEVGGTW